MEVVPGVYGPRAEVAVPGLSDISGNDDESFGHGVFISAGGRHRGLVAHEILAGFDAPVIPREILEVESDGPFCALQVVGKRGFVVV